MTSVTLIPFIRNLSRLGLTRGEFNAEPRLPRKERAAKSTPRLQFQMLRKVYENGEPVVAAPVVSEHRCTLFELSKQRCRWPISTPGAEDFCFCGNTPLEGLPYCSGHSRLAYRPRGRGCPASLFF